MDCKNLVIMNKSFFFIARFRCLVVWALYVLMLLVLSPVARAGAYEDFFKAIELDRAPMMQSLLSRGFDPNTPDADGNSGLFVALRSGALRVADVLITHPQLSVNAENEHGETALMMAALKGWLEPAQRLLARGARINKEGWTPLHYAATGPSTAMVTWLLDRGAAIEAPSPNGTTALMMAAMYGPETSALELMARGALLTSRNQLQMTASDFATRAGRASLAERLRPPGS